MQSRNDPERPSRRNAVLAVAFAPLACGAGLTAIGPKAPPTFRNAIGNP